MNILQVGTIAHSVNLSVYVFVHVSQQSLSFCALACSFTSTTISWSLVPALSFVFSFCALTLAFSAFLLSQALTTCAHDPYQSSVQLV